MWSKRNATNGICVSVIAPKQAVTFQVRGEECDVLQAVLTVSWSTIRDQWSYWKATDVKLNGISVFAFGHWLHPPCSWLQLRTLSWCCSVVLENNAAHPKIKWFVMQVELNYFQNGIYIEHGNMSFFYHAFCHSRRYRGTNSTLASFWSIENGLQHHVKELHDNNITTEKRTKFMIIGLHYSELHI